jgi:Protein of unknown function (DUF1631)
MRQVTQRRIGIVDNPGNQKVTVASCVELVLAQVPGLMDQVLDGLQVVAGLRPTPAGLRVRPDLAPAILQLVDQRASLRNAFAGQVRVLAYGGMSDNRVRPLVRFEDIELLDAHELDENIEIARVRQEIDYAVSETLPRLHALMSAVMGWVSVQPNINPVRPELFAKALRDTLVAHLASTQTRSAVIASAAGRLGLALRGIYRELSGWMQSHGIEPAGAVPLSYSTAIACDPAKANQTTRTVITLERLRRLFAADPGGLDALTGQPGHDFLHTIPASVQALQDMKQVEAMIERLEARKQAQMAESGDAAAQQVNRLHRPVSGGRELGLQIGEEVTRMMLDNLVQDERLLPQVRAVLQGLSPALLPLTRADTRFFSDLRHPARQFLDRVTDRSLAFTDESDPAYQHFVKSVDDAVHGILASGLPMAQAFGQQIELLMARWQHEDKAQTLVREETARALLHVEQRNLLAQRLVEAWRLKLDVVDVPVLVRAFLLGPWAQVVAQEQLDCTSGSSDARGFLALVDDLIWSVQPQQARRDPVRLVSLIPGMLSTLREGLGLITFPQRRINLFLDELIACHESVLHQARQAREQQLPPPAAPAVIEPSQSAPVPDAGPAEPDDPEPSAMPWFADGETEEAGYLEAESLIRSQEDLPLDVSLAQDVVPVDLEAAEADSGTIAEGAWVELMLDGSWTRLKLTWCSPHRTLFMFTSTRGRAHSMSRRSMSRLLASGMIRIVSMGLVLDLALDSVAQQALINSVAARLEA